jgi:sugar lactone lactonase YvrE
MRTNIISLVFQLIIVTTCWGQTSTPIKHRIYAGTGKSVSNTVAYQTGLPVGSAANLPLGNPFGVEFLDDEVLITSVDDHCVYRATLNGQTMQRIVGNGLLGYSGDGGPAIDAAFNWPHEVRADETGNLYIADTRNHAIRRVDAVSGIVTTLAGGGSPGFAGDGERGRSIRFKQPHSVVLDGEGGLLVADTVNHRIRRIDLQTGVIQTISGTGEKTLPVDGSSSLNSPLSGPRSLAVDADSIWIAMREGNSIWRIDRKTETIHHVAGTGAKGYSGDGGPPKLATFKGPKGLVLDHLGRILVVDTENHAVRRIDLSLNRVDTVLGGTHSNETFPLKRPHGIAYKKGTGYLVADSEFHRVLLGR